jgi:outer membrane protein assembly factor BamB
MLTLILTLATFLPSNTAKTTSPQNLNIDSSSSHQAGNKTTQNVTFKLLAIEQELNHTALTSAQHLIKNLISFSNWQNGTTSTGFKYTSYIHLLSNVSHDEIDHECQRYYKGKPTKNNTINEILNFLCKTLPDESNNLSIRIFYYAGHSGKNINEGKTSYCLTLDQPILDWEITQTLSKGSESNSTVIILDTAYSGGFITQLASPGRIILTACNPTETIQSSTSEDTTLNHWGWFTGQQEAHYKNGTYFGPLGIIGGIQNACDNNNDGWRSIAEIFSFAYESVTWYAANQTNPEAKKPYSIHPQCSYGVAGGEIRLIQYDPTKPFPYNAKACTPPSIPQNPVHYSPKQFEHPMYRHNPKRTGYTEALGPQNFSLLWKKSLKEPITTSVAIADSMAFVGTQDGNFYALEITTGKIIWSFHTDSQISSSPAVKNGMVFFGTEKPGNLYALDEYTGLIRWVYEIPTGAAVYSSPAIANGRLYFSSLDGYVHALTQFEGAPLWTNFIGGGIRSSPAVADGMIFINSLGVYALDEVTGSVTWRYRTEWSISATPAVADGAVIVGAENDDEVYALDEMTGTLLWSHRAGGWFSSSAVNTEKNLVIVGCRDSRIYALSKATGFRIWTYVTNGPNHISSPTISNNGLVYIGSADGNIYCLDEDTGEKLWNYTIGDPVYSSPTIIYNHLFIGSHDGDVYCFGPAYPIHDTAVLNTTISNNTIRSGEPVNITYTVKNNGTQVETFALSCAYNTSDIWIAPKYLEPTIISTETVTLTPKAILTHTYTWNTTSIQPGLYSISVEAHLLPDEIDATFNTHISYTIFIIHQADLDANGKINILDLAIVAKAYGSTPEDDNWEPQADLDDNGIINIVDIAAVAKEFGKTYI